MPTGRNMGHRGPSIADKARIARAIARAVDLAPVLTELQQSGITSLNGIAAALNERGVPTPAGSSHLVRIASCTRDKATGGVT
jgi:hypothetical protein